MTEKFSISDEDKQTEQMVLGCIFHNPEQFEIADEKLKEEFFGSLSHRYLWRGMRSLKSSDLVIDKPHLENWLEKNNHLDKMPKNSMGAVIYLDELEHETPFTAKIEDHIRRVVSNHWRRKTEEISLELAVHASERRILDYTTTLAKLGIASEKWRNSAAGDSGSNGKHFHLIHAASIDPRPADWLIEGVLESDSLAMIFGDPGSCKSFMSLDWACCIALGIPWNGKAVKQAPVVYLAGEGRNGIVRRLRAWEIANHQILKDAPLYLSSGPVALCDDKSASDVTQAVSTLSRELEVPVGVIVVDTLARNFGPGDENSTSDMNAVLGTLDKIRAEHNATVLLDHHTGHGDKSRARGSMALKAALDAEYRMERDTSGAVRMTTTKMKDAVELEPMMFKLIPVELGMEDERGNPVTSAVLRVAEWIEPTVKSAAGRGKNQTKAMGFLKEIQRNLLGHAGNEDRRPDEIKVGLHAWRTACHEGGINSRRFPEVIKGLENSGKIRINDGYVFSE